MMRVIRQNYDSGFILPVLLFTTLFISLITMYVGSLSLTTYKLANREIYKTNAQMAADAGLDQAMTLLNTVGSSGFTGAQLSETELLNSGNVRTTYTKTLLNGTSDSKKIVSVVAKTYAPASSTTPKITRRYELDVQAVTTGSAAESVVTGVGGLILRNNAKITGGDVVVNGTVKLENNAQIGLSSTPSANAMNIRVAHTNCPNPVTSTYPRVCASGENGQPITMDNNAKIYGDVRATNQTTGTNMSNPGLVPNQTVAPSSLPDYDRAAQKAAVTTTVTKDDPYDKCKHNGVVSWPANLKVVGDLKIDDKCTLTINGNVWVTGHLKFDNKVTMVIADSLGTTKPVIMIDGKDGVDFGKNNLIQPNSSGTGAFFITYWCGDSCSPDTTNLTGSALKAVQDKKTIEFSNNSQASASVLYARWSMVSIENNGAIGAVAGQTIELRNNAVINFTASVPGSDNLTTTWAKRGYMRVYQ